MNVWKIWLKVGRNGNVNLFRVYNTNNNIPKYKIICDWKRLNKNTLMLLINNRSQKLTASGTACCVTARASWVLYGFMGLCNLRQRRGVHVYIGASRHVTTSNKRGGKHRILTRDALWWLLKIELGECMSSASTSISHPLAKKSTTVLF